MIRIASLLVSALAAPGALADEWRMQDDGELHFEPTWEGDVVPGRFGDFDVRLDTGEGGIAGSELVVTVSLESADMDDPDINEAIAGADWFAVSKFPVATYTSETIEAMSGEVVIDRTRFDVGSGEWASGEPIGTAVGVRFRVTLERQ